MSNFVIDCMNGDALMSDIEDYVLLWHESNEQQGLHDYLGMTKKEYALYVEDEGYLGLIITAHRDQISIELLMRDEMALAARSDDPAKSIRLQKWLESEGLWE